MRWPWTAQKERDSARQHVIDQMGERADARAAEAKQDPYAGDAKPYPIVECDARHPEWPKVKRLCTMERGHGKIEGRPGAASWGHKSEVKGELTVVWTEQDVPVLHPTEFRIPIESLNITGLSAMARLVQNQMRETTEENLQRLRVENVQPVIIDGKVKRFKGEAVFETWRPGR